MSLGETTDEVVLLQKYIQESQRTINSIIVVSDPYHMRRARWTNRFVLGKRTEILMAPVPFEQTPFEQRWWEDRESREYVKDEYKKFFYYIARYQLSWGPVKEWLASLEKN